MSVTPSLVAQMGSIISYFPSCTTKAGGGGCREKGELKNLKAITVKTGHLFCFCNSSAKSPSLLLFLGRQSLFPP